MSSFASLLPLIGVALIFAIPVLWIVGLIDILKSSFAGSNKLIWILVVLFLPILGTILYWSIGRKQKVLVDQT
ncbi:MAG: PLDc_N domain-containing protein [Nitrospirae bacterium]|nr:PLDc_N domain-containing protein [Nitrospirota bacterium]